MKELIIEVLINFISTYMIVFLFYVLIINRKRKKYVVGKKEIEINYIIKKFDLDMRITKYNKLKWIVTIVNSFIIAFTFTITIFIKSYLLGLLTGLVLMMLLYYSIYEIIGRSLKKKEGIKNV